MTYKTTFVAQKKKKCSAGEKQQQGIGRLFCVVPGRHYVCRNLLEAVQAVVTIAINVTSF